MYDAEGRLLPAKEWPAWAATTVSGLETAKRRLAAADGARESVIRVRVWDKLKALEILARHLGILKESVETSVLR